MGSRCARWGSKYRRVVGDYAGKFDVDTVTWYYKNSGEHAHSPSEAKLPVENGGLWFHSSLVLHNRRTSLVPPLSLSVEYALPINLPLNVGAVIGFTSSERQEKIWDAKFTYTWSVFSIGAKVAYHVNWPISELDTYATLTLGANFLNAQSEYNEDYY